MDSHKRKSRLIRRAIGGCSLILAIGIAWLIVTNTFTAGMARSDPEAAMARDGRSSVALTALAQKSLEDGNLPLAEQSATQALNVTPLAQPALRVLGLAADRRGDTERARQIMTFAGQMALHDAATQFWLLNDDLMNGRAAEAIGQADIILRTKPQVAAQLVPPLAAIASDDNGRRALVDELLGNPPWRPWLLQALPNAAGSSVAYAVLGELSSRGATIGDDEIRPLLNQLVADGNFQLAFLTWLRMRPDWPVDQFLSDGGFDKVLGGIPFDWILAPIPGAKTEIVDSRNNQEGPALRITFANTRVAYKNVRKLLLLRPGRYSLSGLVRMNELHSDQGMAWRLYCANGDKQRLAESEHFSGTEAWRTFAVQFAVPESGCSAQWLQLEHAARTAVEQQIGGEIWFDHMAIELDQAATALN